MPVWLAQGRGWDLPDHRCIWDWIKYNLRAHAIQFSKRKAKQKKVRRTYCKMNLTMQSKTSNAILPIKMQVNAAKEKLEHFYEEKLQGLIRARASWCEHGEKSTKYFLNLEKRNQWIRAMKRH